MISIFLTLFRYVLWPSMWSTLVNIPRELEKNVSSFVGGWSVL